MTVELSVLADVAGKVGNGYAVGTINKILDPLAFVSTVENIDVTGGGSDVESDAQPVSASNWRHRNIHRQDLGRVTSFTRKVPTP